MGDKSKIEWTDATWNPVAGCSKVSGGCDNCYAIGQAHRLGSNPATPAYHGLTQITNGRPNWTGQVHLVESALELPLRWRKLRRIFVNSMSDLFHESVPDEWIDRIFAVMALCPQHTFQVLTKRPERMRNYLTTMGRHWSIWRQIGDENWGPHAPKLPLPNVWLGTSAEDQETADQRIPELLQTPAAVRWVSLEPLLGPVSIVDYLGRCVRAMMPDDTFSHGNGLDWVVVGGESGPRARPLDVQWARDVIAQCKEAGVPCFVKQLGAEPFSLKDKIAPRAGFSKRHDGNKLPLPDGFYRCLCDRKGSDPSEWPEDLRVREYPA